MEALKFVLHVNIVFQKPVVQCCIYYRLLRSLEDAIVFHIKSHSCFLKAHVRTPTSTGPLPSEAG